MAQRRTETWLTCAVDDSTVSNVLVLGESIRRSKTTRTIAVIICKNVSRGKRMELRKTFDVVLSMSDYHITEGALKGQEEAQAMVFAFSLGFLGKCVFLSPNSFMLENADKFFEDAGSDFNFIRDKETGTIDLSFFVFEPCKELWEHLWEILLNGNDPISLNSFLSDWVLNQRDTRKVDWLPTDAIAKFSLSRASILRHGDDPRAPIVQFVDMKKDIDLYEQLNAFDTVNLGLVERLISNAWMETYRNKTSIAASLLNMEDYTETFRNEPIAIIGMSCRYPGANNLEEFWDMLHKGGEGVREPPAFRWTKEHSIRVSPAERKTNAGFLAASVDEFDARFFGVSPKDAVYMDPQARLLHEVLWESLEDSGIDPHSLHGTHTGIFTGSWMNDYKEIASQGSTERDFFRTYMGNSIGAAAARLSFLLGLTGPSIATESGCSSAIVAVDLAVKSLRSGETNLAMAGGVNLLLHPFTTDIMELVMAPDGRCKTFDSKADGC